MKRKMSTERDKSWLDILESLVKIPIVRNNGFDPTKAGGHGLLEEISIVELRERIEF